MVGSGFLQQGIAQGWCCKCHFDGSGFQERNGFFIGGADVTVKKIPTPIQIISLKKI
jgi:hypothetical protein